MIRGRLLTERNERMFLLTFLVVNMAPTRRELDNDLFTVSGIVQKYDLQDVLSAIEGKEKRPGRSERKISLAVDIQAKLAAGKGPGYERWAKVFNIKQMAAALAYIQDNGLTDYEQLAQKATEAADDSKIVLRIDNYIVLLF